MALEELTDGLVRPVTRRRVLKTGAKLAYAAPLVAASMRMSRGGVAAISGGGGCLDLGGSCGSIDNISCWRASATTTGACPCVAAYVGNGPAGPCATDADCGYAGHVHPRVCLEGADLAACVAAG